ncbi:PTS lactose transporter subunit IIC [Tersicoccus solisilvae]|uniref:PTS lactose transporter subunit IIC n=1 Tax=Tersicoccus solisilvae TaxID=1882339 RepID=A0ABQ1NUB9_9MICC|nr:fructose-specific PTS transporter subunit EIIC [Tersicoccus solisilvae]GGC83512.1 PTS lactose transporter subunit IIC [Tersicoccus solisilvae]
MSSMIIPELVTLDQDLGGDKSAVIRHLASSIVSAGRADDLEGLYGDAWARESKTATGVPGGIGIPHCKSAHVTTPSLAMARLPRGVDWGANDGPADIVFFIAATEGADQAHLKLLAKLARSLIKKDFTAALRAARTPQEVVDLVEDAISDQPAAAPAQPAAGAGTGVTEAVADERQANAGADATGATAAGAAAGGAAGAAGSDVRSAPAEGAGAEAGTGAGSGGRKSLVAVTACPTGIAHTYMAADSLQAAADEMGVPLQVETQGSAGATPLPKNVIDDAAAVIFAVEVDVRDKGRFAGKPVIQGPVKRGIDEPKQMIEEALAAADNPNARRVGGAADTSVDEGAGESFGAKTKKVLLTGVSYMIPFVAAGGLLIALGFLFGGYDIALNQDNGKTLADNILANNSIWNLPTDVHTESPLAFLGPFGLYLGAVLFKVGGLSMGFLVPALAGYIAYGMADRPGIAPGFTAGAVAGFMGAGFIGGLVGGVLAGAVAHYFAHLSAPRWLRGLMPVVIIPLLASLVAGGLMLFILGAPIVWLTNALNAWLTGLSGAAAIGLGIILGLMMAFDLGGPVNKVAYSFAVAGLAAGSVSNTAPYGIMAAVMAAGMVPPLALALATALDKKHYSLAERENGKAAWLLGASFISEGAIPFAAADPLRVIPASMVGAAVTGATIMGLGVTSRAPHGGIFVFFAMNNPLLFILAIILGTVVSAAALIALKRVGTRRPEADREEVVSPARQTAAA